MSEEVLIEQVQEGEIVEKNKGGRPLKNHKTGPVDNWKMTPEIITKLDYSFALGCTIADACAYACIAPTTYHRWVNENPELKERFSLLQESPTLKARKTVVSVLNKPEHAWKWLEKKKPQEFGVKQQVEVTGDIGLHATIPAKVKALSEKFEKELEDEL